MLNYLLEVTLCWGIFYLIYALLLSRQTFFVANRWYLISTLALGLVIPLVEWQPSVIVEQLPIISTVEPLQITVQQFEQQIIVAQQRNHFNWWNVLLALYWVGVGAFTLRFGHGLWKIWQTYRSSEIVQNGKYRIVYTNTSHLPYSFFHCLFWSKQFEAELSEQQQILRHEEAHINGWHTLDVLWMEILSILFWCSPIIYLYRISMRNVHEYLADAWVLQTTNKRTYGRLLLSHSLSGFQIALANNFINSQLKKRILMMTRHESPRHALMRYMWLLPIVMLTFLIFSKKENRAVLKAQFGTFSKQPYAEIYKRLEESHNSETWNYLVAEYGELIKKHPEMRHEIAIMSSQLAQKQGFTFIANEFTANTFLIHPDQSSNVLHEGIDRLPRFMECKRFGTSALAKDICAESRMHEFIYRHLAYPEATKKYGYEGEVYVRMHIEADGSTSKITTEHLRDVDAYCEREALRIAEKMRMNWLPAERNGQAVACDIIVPFIFSPNGVPALYAPDLVNRVEAHEHTRDTLLAEIELDKAGEFGTIKITRNSKKSLSDEAFINIINERKGDVIPRRAWHHFYPVHAQLIYSARDQSIISYEAQSAMNLLTKRASFSDCASTKDWDEDTSICSEEKRNAFITKHLRYPKEAIRAGYQGKIIATILVKKDGTIIATDIVNSPNEGVFDKEIKRVIGLMPKWTPAERNGTKVESKIEIPFYFTLNEEGAIATTPKLKYATDSNYISMLSTPNFPSCKGCIPSFSANEADDNMLELIYKRDWDSEDKGKAILGYGIVDFVIETTGYLSEISIVQRVNPEFDKGMIEALKKIYAWEVPSTNRLPYHVRCHVPVFEDTKNVHFESTTYHTSLTVEHFKVAWKNETITLQFQAESTPINVRLADDLGRDIYNRTLNKFEGSFNEVIHSSADDEQIYFLHIEQNGKTLVKHINLALPKRRFSIIPIPEGTNHKITSGFGLRIHPVHKVEKMHKGVDFKADLGSPVIATENGTVLMTKFDEKAYGKHIIIEHADGFQTLYAHLNEIQVQAGQTVKRGEVIGKVGATGYATMPHLHYEIIKEGKKVDPMEFIKMK